MSNFRAVDEICRTYSHRADEWLPIDHLARLVVEIVDRVVRDEGTRERLRAQCAVVSARGSGGGELGEKASAGCSSCCAGA